MGRKKKVKKKKFKVTFEYALDDLITDREDEDEVNFHTEYVGKYILRRMTFGDNRAIEAGLMKINTEVKGKGKKKELEADIVTDISHWQEDILAFSIFECPFGSRPKGGWIKGDLDGLKDFIYELPKIIGDELLEVAIIMNDFTEEDLKN